MNVQDKGKAAGESSRGGYLSLVRYDGLQAWNILVGGLCTLTGKTLVASVDGALEVCRRRTGEC